MVSNIPKLKRTAKEIILIPKKTSALYFKTIQCFRVFCFCSSETVIYLHSGRAATEYAQTAVRQSKKEEALPLL